MSKKLKQGKEEILSPIFRRKLKKPSMFWNSCIDCTEHFYSGCQGLYATMCCSCGYWERDTGRCLIHGEIPDFRGCCLMFAKVKVYPCINALVTETKDKRIYCSLLQSQGCEECYKSLMSKFDELEGLR